MIRIEILPTANDAVGYDFSDSVAVVIDVLRATSVICVALSNGASCVRPVISPDEAFAIRGQVTKGKSNFVLGGERSADRIEGFDLGNSPQDYTARTVSGKQVLLTTTNGTVALSKCSAAPCVITASMLNAEAAAKLAYAKIRQMVETLTDVDAHVVLLCSGNYGRPTLEDTICAGMVAQRMEKYDEVRYMSDNAIAARMMAETYDPQNPERWFAHAKHYNRLVTKGYVEDISICLSQPDTLRCVPIMNDKGVLVVADDVEA